MSRELRILTIPVGLELEMLEEGLSAAESDHNNVNQQSNANGNYITLYTVWILIFTGFKFLWVLLKFYIYCVRLLQNYRHSESS